MLCLRLSWDGRKAAEMHPSMEWALDSGLLTEDEMASVLVDEVLRVEEVSDGCD